MERLRHIVADSLGFGLGVAWNVFLMQLLGPDDMSAAHIVALFGYLVVVLMIAFRLAAMVDPTEQEPTLMQRTYSMLSFAFNVVCAFTMVAFVSALLLPGWIGDGLCLVILIVLAAVLSAGVAAVDSETTTVTAQEQQALMMEQGESQPKIGFGTCCALDALIFCPCVWCCCPWIPLIWILAGITPDVHVKERWQKLIAFVLGLATSIQASGMLTKATNEAAIAMHVCGEKYCDNPLVFILIQLNLAVVTTAVLLPLLAFVSEPVQFEGTDGMAAGEQSEQQGEKRPLLQKVRKYMPKISKKSSKVERKSSH